MTTAAGLDPRTKLVVIACLTSSAVIMTHWIYLTGICLLSFLLLLIFGVSPWSIMKKARVLVYMVLVIALMQSLFVSGGHNIVAIGKVKLVTTGGLLMTGEFILRMLIIIASAGILSTSSSREIIQGLIQWKLPYELAFMAAMGIRFLPVFGEELRNAIIAVQLRGVDFKALHFKQKIEIFTGLFQPLVAGAMIKSRAIAMSLEMRGFRAYSIRTSYMELQCSLWDYGVMIGAVLLTVMVMISYFIMF